MVEQMNINLDNLETYRSLDPEKMLNHIRNFPALCRQAVNAVQNFRLPPEYAHINKILILGMGGSAIGGDLVNSLVVHDSRLPITVCREYEIPRSVDSQTLVIASSYSGMTEETLSAFKEALDTPAKKLAITTGGKLQTLCRQMGVPVFAFDYQSQPRAALPFSFFILLGILQKLALFQDMSQDTEIALADLEATASKINETVPLPRNPAKALAQKIAGHLPVIYGAGITAVVAQRWKTQINENSKSMAYFEVFSELNHNAIVGYSAPEEIAHQTMIVLLDSDLLHERIKLRYQITQQLLEKSGIYYQVVKAEGRNALSQMLELVFFGDYVSYYLAMLNQVDPTPVAPIDFLKNALANK